MWAARSAGASNAAPQAGREQVYRTRGGGGDEGGGGAGVKSIRVSWPVKGHRYGSPKMAAASASDSVGELPNRAASAAARACSRNGLIPLRFFNGNGSLMAVPRSGQMRRMTPMATPVTRHMAAGYMPGGAGELSLTSFPSTE